MMESMCVWCVCVCVCVVCVWCVCVVCVYVWCVCGVYVCVCVWCECMCMCVCVRERETVSTISNPPFCHTFRMWVRITLPVHIDYFPEQQNISVFIM